MPGLRVVEYGRYMALCTLPAELHLPSACCIFYRFALFESFVYVYKAFWSPPLPHVLLFSSLPILSAPPHPYRSLTQSPDLVLFCDPFVTIGLELFHWSLTKSPVSTKWKILLSLNVPQQWGWELSPSSIYTWAHSYAGRVYSSAAATISCWQWLCLACEITFLILGSQAFSFFHSLFFSSPWALVRMFRARLWSVIYSQWAILPWVSAFLSIN